MRNNIKYQPLDPSQSPSCFNYRYLILIFLILSVFLIYYLLFKADNGYSNSSQAQLISSRLSYDDLIDDLRKQINGRNEMVYELEKDLKLLGIQSGLVPSFRRRPETAHIDCGRVLSNDKDYIKSVGGDDRVKMTRVNDINMTCDAIIQRIITPKKLDELAFGVAFARIVYTDYEMIEDQLRISYHPQNVFCYSIDHKSQPLFHERMKNLASCLPNVILLLEEQTIDSSGHNMNLATYNCMKALVNKPGWGYMIILQNHDVIVKSVYELVEIYKMLGGANDVEITPEVGRVDRKMKWDARSLKLFRDDQNITKEVLDTPMKFAKGAAQGSLSRAAVEWMVSVDVSSFINQMNTIRGGVDELFIQSFQVSDFLGMPGHFTDECLKQKKSTDFVSRMSKWLSADECASKVVRHSICMLGIEDFRTIAQYPNIMVNKMMPDFDYSIMECTGELIFNRTYLGQIDKPLERDYYENMVNVLYHKHRNDSNYTLDCEPKYKDWSVRTYPL